MAEFNTFNSTITLGVGSTDIKAILLEDPDMDNPEPSLNEEKASDGTTYTFLGDEATPTFAATIMLTNSTLNAIATAIYGAGSTVGDVTTWDLEDAGGTINDIIVTSPINDDGATISMKAVNAEGLRLKPLFKLNNGFQAEIKFKCDRWQLIHDLTA